MGLEQGLRPKINPNFESFGKPEGEQRDKLFINKYGGHYAQRMELNRKAIEQTLRLAHLNGQVFLASFPFSRDRSVDANSDGSLTAKKSAIFGQKLEEEDKNPYYRIVSIPEGWKIEINNQLMMDELLDKRLTPEKSQKLFIDNFDNSLTNGLVKCILKEKLSKTKDERFNYKLFISIFHPVFNGWIYSMPPQKPEDIIRIPIFTVLGYGFYNILLKMYARDIDQKREMLRDYGIVSSGSNFISRKIDHLWEIGMPPVEIDKVAESIGYLYLSGQKLVREKP